MLATHLGLPYWLQENVTEPALLVLQDPTGPLFSLLIVIIVGTAVYSLRESLDLPVVPRRNIWAARRAAHSRRKTKKARKSQSIGLFWRSPKSTPERGRKLNDQQSPPDELDGPRRPVRVPDHSELPEWEPPRDDSGLIMLEID